MHSTLRFDIGPVRRQRARWPGLGAALATAAGALCVLLDPPMPGYGLVLLAAAAGLAAWTGWRSGRAGEAGRLLVDATGAASWLVATTQPARVPVVPLYPCRWHLAADEVWLLARDGHGQRLHLRMGRRDCDERQWRALRRWLVWSGRAGAAAIRT